MATMAEMADAAQRTASGAMYGGATLSAGSGATMFWGLSAVEWQIAGIVCGIVIGFAGLVGNLAFQYLRFRRENFDAAR